MEPQHFRPIVDDATAFRAAMQRAEEAAGITRDENGDEQVAEETPVATPEGPEAVPVQASDQPLIPEPVTAVVPSEPDTSEQQPAVPDPPVEPAAPQTIEELQAELAKAQARLDEKDAFIGRQSGEVGELRGVVDELKARVDAQPAQPAVPQAAQVVITQDMIDSNPAQAVEIAFAQKNEQALGVAFEAWKDADEFSAGQWLTEKRWEQREATLRAELEATRSEMKNIAAPIAQSAEESAAQGAWNVAFATVAKDRPDFLQHAERLLTEVAPKYPHLVSTLADGDGETKSEVLAVLYDLDRVANPDRFKQELEGQAAEAAAEAAAARQGAHVVSQTTVGQPGVEKTAEELEQDAYVHRMGARASLARGWTGRS